MSTQCCSLSFILPKGPILLETKQKNSPQNKMSFPTVQILWSTKSRVSCSTIQAFYACNRMNKVVDILLHLYFLYLLKCRRYTYVRKSALYTNKNVTQLNANLGNDQFEFINAFCVGQFICQGRLQAIKHPDQQQQILTAGETAQQQLVLYFLFLPQNGFRWSVSQCLNIFSNLGGHVAAYDGYVPVCCRVNRIFLRFERYQK